MPDKVALLTALLTDRSVCADCIIAKTGLTYTDIDPMIAVIARVLTLHHDETGRCRLCDRLGPVFALERWRDG